MERNDKCDTLLCAIINYYIKALHHILYSTKKPS